MQFESKDGKTRFDAIRINHVAFSGQAFTGAPFEGDDGDGWIHGAISSGMVSMVSGDATEHAVWAVNVGNGEAVLASPGDYVVKQVGAEALYVCLGSLWELLTNPSPQAAESIGEACDTPQTDVNDKVEVVVKERQAEFDVTKWCNYVEECLGKPDIAWDVDWQMLFDELDKGIGEAETLTMPARAFYLCGVLSHLIFNRLKPEDRYFKNSQMWADIIQEARKNGDVFLEHVLKDRVDGGDGQDMVTLASTVLTATPKEIGGMVLESPLDYEERMNAWCDRVHREYLNLKPNMLRPWIGLAEEVEVIMAGREVASLPRAWLIAYGTVHAMAKQYHLLKPGVDEESMLISAKDIGAAMANQLLGSVD